MEKNLKNRIWYLIIAVGALLLAAFFGSRKQGYYIDEYYTYTLSNGTQLGIAIDEGHWQKTDAYLDQLVSGGDENFRFSQVYENNANDVHPPLYYYLFHLLSSFSPGVFSKWTGIGLNLFLWCFCLALAATLSREIAGDDRLSLLAFAAYAFSPAIISGLMLIRMYVMLQLFVMLYALILVKDMSRDHLSVRGFLIPVFLTGFFGFLTQYYFVIAMFFMTFFYCVYLFLRKEGWVKRVLCFGAAALFSLAATVIPWRVSIFHIFKGYRGADSVSSLVSTTNIASRASLFFGNLNKNVFGGMIIIYLLVIAAGFLKKGEKPLLQEKKDKLALLSLSAACYFLVIAKIGLKAGDASNRYEYPVYGLIILLSVTACHEALLRVAEKKAFIFTVFLTALTCFSGYFHSQVLYLYPQEKVIDDMLKERSDAQIAVFQRDDGKYDTRIKDFLKRDEVYWGSSKEAISLPDKRPLFVYIDVRDDDGVYGTPVFTTPGNEFNVYYVE